jgi:hypothetical protein
MPFIGNRSIMTPLGGRTPRDAKSTASHCDLNSAATAQVHRFDDVGGRHTLRDQRWTEVDHAVLEAAGMLIVLVAWLEEAAAE